MVSCMVPDPEITRPSGALLYAVGDGLGSPGGPLEPDGELLHPAIPSTMSAKIRTNNVRNRRPAEALWLGVYCIR